MAGQSIAVQYFLPFTIAMIMLAMGLGLVVDDFRRVFDKPRSVLVGLVSQIVLLPMLGFAVAFGFGLRPELAVGVVLLTACPGGAHSNLYASFARADVALSVTLTAVSGFITIVTIPPLVRLATAAFATGGEVPELPILDTSLRIFAVMAIPVVLGMLIRARTERWARRLEALVKGVAIVLLALIVIGSIARQSDDVAEFARQAGVPVLVLNVVAMLLGYGMAALARLSRPQRRTISLEVGIQNGALAFALAAGLLDSVAVAIPAILYSILVYFTGAVVIVDGRLRP
ncbi:MAG: bile acid:sodium symporter family protein [Myxococcales bacterium]|nr:MAG: bile acid:sodium symporter family protein [Myxococcales bacterium]